VAATVFATLADAPGVRVAHRTVFHPSEVLAAIGDYRPSVVFNLCEALGGDSRLEVHAAWLLERLAYPSRGARTTRSATVSTRWRRTTSSRARASASRRPSGWTARPAPQGCLPGDREAGAGGRFDGIERDSVVYEVRALRDRVAWVIETLKQPAVVQRYIHGREIGVSLVGWPVPRVLPPGEILFGGLPPDHPHILTFSSKWDPESVDWTGTSAVPAVLRPREQRRVAAIGRRAFEVLGLRTTAAWTCASTSEACRTSST